MTFEFDYRFPDFWEFQKWHWGKKRDEKDKFWGNILEPLIKSIIKLRVMAIKHLKNKFIPQYQPFFDSDKVILNVKRFYSKGQKVWDDDNLRSIINKFIIDQLVQRNFLKDDTPNFLTWGKVEQIKAKENKWVIEFNPVPLNAGLKKEKRNEGKTVNKEIIKIRP